MDELRKLAEAVFRQDKARAELYTATCDVNAAMRADLERLWDAGVLKIRVDRGALDRILHPHPETARAR